MGTLLVPSTERLIPVFPSAEPKQGECQTASSRSAEIISAMQQMVLGPRRAEQSRRLQQPPPGSPSEAPGDPRPAGAQTRLTPPLKLCSLSQPFAHLVPNTQGGTACAGDAQRSFGSEVAQLSPSLHRGELTEPCLGSKARRHLASGASPEVWGRILGACTATAWTGQ